MEMELIRAFTDRVDTDVTNDEKNKMRQKTPIENLGQQTSNNPESEPLKKWPNQVNPHTGETGGPSGPEPTRYGDWERKGRVTDF